MQGYAPSYSLPQAQQKQQALDRLVCLLQKQNAIIAATADVQQHIQTLLLVVQQQVRPAVMELGFKTMGRTAAVKSFLTDFLDLALLLRHPLAQAVQQASSKLPTHKTPEVDRSMYSLLVLEDSIWATRRQNSKLHTTYSDHCELVELLLGLMTYDPSGICTLHDQLCAIAHIPQHQLPCSSAAAYAWLEQVECMSPVFMFRHPSSVTRADLGAVEASCVCTISDTLYSPVQQCPGSSSGSASDDGEVCNDSSSSSGSSGAIVCTSPATSCASSPASQRPISAVSTHLPTPASAVSTQPSTPTPPPQQPKVSILARAAAKVKRAVGTLASWCMSAVKKVASAVRSWL